MAPTLLLADDSITMQRVIELTFAPQGIQVIAVGDGDEAVTRLRSDPPNIVLASIGLSKVDGYGVARFMQSRENLRRVPILLMSGAFDAVDEARVRESGASGVLVKPFEPQLVINRVKELLGITAKPAPRPVGGAPPASGRLLTSDDAPRAARPPMHEPAFAPPPTTVADAAPAYTEPAMQPVASPEPVVKAEVTPWDQLMNDHGPAQAVAEVEPAAGTSEDYFEQLDAAFDTLDAQLSGGRRATGSRSSGPPLVPRMPAAIDPSRRPSALVNEARTNEAKSDQPVFEVDSDWFGAAQAAADVAGGGSPDSEERVEVAAASLVGDADPIDVFTARVELAPLYEPPPAEAIASFDYLKPAPQVAEEPWAPAPATPAPEAPWAPAAPVEEAPWAPAPVAQAPVEAPWAPAPPAPIGPAPSYSANESAVADAFAALLAEEQGEPLPVMPEDPSAAFDLSEATVDRIAMRVVDRLTHGVMGETVMRVVSEVSERLVREEIARIRTGAKP